jgi:excisionase family DNA binding protein
MQTLTKEQKEGIKLLVSKKEAAAMLSVSLRTIDNLLICHELISRKVGTRRLIPLSALEAFARRDHSTQDDDRRGR